VEHGLFGTHGVLGIRAARSVHLVETRDTVARAEVGDVGADFGDSAADVVALVYAHVEVVGHGMFPVFGVAAGDGDFDEDFVAAIFTLWWVELVGSGSGVEWLSLRDWDVFEFGGEVGIVVY
jgi:hypothetical protein